MADLKQLLAQKAALEKQIEDTQREQREQAVRQVRELMARHGLSAADLQQKRPSGTSGANKRTTRGGGTKVAVKFRNAETGETWSGRGLQPRWLKAALGAGRKLDDFRV